MNAWALASLIAPLLALPFARGRRSLLPAVLAAAAAVLGAGLLALWVGPRVGAAAAPATRASAAAPVAALELAAAVLCAACVVATWRPLVVQAAPARAALGLALAAVGLCAQAMFLSGGAWRWVRVAAGMPRPPVALTLWTVAGLLLLEPATRICRAVVSLAGRAPATGHGGNEPSGEVGRGAGELIGVLERWVLLPFLVKEAYAALGFVLAAKALARHKQMEEKAFAEYFLIGTLTSVLLAIVVAAALRAALRALGLAMS
jgi:hypothetical protein